MVSFPTLCFRWTANSHYWQLESWAETHRNRRCWRLSHPWCCPVQFRISEPQFFPLAKWVHVLHWIVWGVSEILSVKTLAQSCYSMNDSYYALRLVVLGNIFFPEKRKDKKKLSTEEAAITELFMVLEKNTQPWWISRRQSGWLWTVGWCTLLCYGAAL